MANCKNWKFLKIVEQQNYGDNNMSVVARGGK